MINADYAVKDPKSQARSFGFAQDKNPKSTKGPRRKASLTGLAGQGGIWESEGGRWVFWKSERRLLKEKGRGVNQKNHDGLWGFSILIGGCPLVTLNRWLSPSYPIACGSNNTEKFQNPIRSRQSDTNYLSSPAFHYQPEVPTGRKCNDSQLRRFGLLHLSIAFLLAQNILIKPSLQVGQTERHICSFFRKT